MLLPYLTLGLDPNAADLDDTMVRQAYLNLTRRYPPSTHGRQFAAIAAAYEQLKSERLRLANGRCLAPQDTETTFTALIDAATMHTRPVKLADILAAMGRTDA